MPIPPDTISVNHDKRVVYAFLWKGDFRLTSRLYPWLATALCTALTILSAFIRVPIPGTGVLFTAQVCAVLCCGLLLGPGWGAVSQLLYIALGLIGVPVFSAGGGLGYALTPGFGYLLGFVAAADVTGLIARLLKKRSFPRFCLAAAAGAIAMYVIALGYILLLTRITGAAIGMDTFLWSYCLAFLPMDAIKVALAAASCALIFRRLPRRYWVS